MKYLKTYENIGRNFKFSIGDFVKQSPMSILVKVKKSNNIIYKIIDRITDRDQLKQYKIVNVDDKNKLNAFWEYEFDLLPLTSEDKNIMKYNV